MSTTITPSLPVGGGLPPELLPSPLPAPSGPALARARRRHAAVAVLSALMAMVLFALLAFHGYIAWIIAHPYVPPLTSNPMEAKGLAYQDVSFPSASGRTTVHGWYIPAASADAGAASSKRTIIFSHGYGANREESWVPMYDLAGLLHRLHYNVLMFDYGYASHADPSPATGGYEESQELLAAIHYAKTHGTDQLIVWGFSMGAGTALQAALQTDQIDALLLDSLFLPSPDALYANIRQYLDLPRFPSLPLIQWMLPFWTGTGFNYIPAKQVEENAYPFPVYVMHGTDDGTAPLTTAEEIASRQVNPLSREWIVKGGKHELLFKVYPREYIQRAVVFLAQVDNAYKTAHTA
ncbi:alpha/beta hydrolase [Paenibacillus humicola]|uniref:alpha/beta hydrolase n=1 Tax=Paenibacillus humicola TaxID=3110540 RepID=UPI00237BEEC5|nr:alpha/beta fold hydrolase [Paenibacillus humicola]